MITQSNKAIVLRKEVWEIQEDPNDGNPRTIIKPIPESWHSIQSKVPNLLALFCCPECNIITGADIRVSKVDTLGRLTPTFRCIPCGFYGDIYFDEYWNKPLYALALVDQRKKEIELRYTHADTQIEASKGIDLNRYSVIGIGRAIGYKVMDKQGNELSV